jgi:hypothetical protein
MAILKQSTEWVEEVEKDENGDRQTRRFTRPRLDFVCGPVSNRIMKSLEPAMASLTSCCLKYWPMLCLITYPLILGVSGLTLVTRIPYKHPLIVLAWLICTVGLIWSLALTAHRDPGILPRYEKPPASQDASSWRWSDRTHSYKPRGSFYDPDTGVIVQDFDHTCPWTGTAIGKKNLGSFHWFVALVFVCLVFNIVLLTDAV